MGQRISTDESSATEAAQSYRKELDAYCSFTMKTIAHCAPVDGSTKHDNLGVTVNSALEQWGLLLESDVQAVLDINKELGATDSACARMLLGAGE